MDFLIQQIAYNSILLEFLIILSNVASYTEQ